MLKLLWCRLDRTGYWGNQHDALQEAAKKYADITFVTNKLIIKQGEYTNTMIRYFKSDKPNCFTKLGKFNIGGTIPKLLHYLTKDNYDFIIVDCEIINFGNEPWEIIDVPKLGMLHDLHKRSISVSFFRNHNFNIITTRYKNALLNVLPEAEEIKDKISWLPGCVNINLFYDYKLNKKYNVTITGHIGGAYPFREYLVKRLENDSRVKIIKRPKNNIKNAWPVGVDYAKLLNQSKISISTTSKYYYPLMKNYEIMASNALLMVDNISEFQELGFYPNKHFVDIPRNNIKKVRDKISAFLDDKNLREKISNEGFKKVHEKHNSDYRAKELLNLLCQYLNKPFQFPEVGINNYLGR